MSDKVRHVSHTWPGTIQYTAVIVTVLMILQILELLRGTG